MTRRALLSRLAPLLVLLAPPLHAQGPLFGEPHRNLPHDGFNTRGLAHGDLDGDGDEDYLMAGHFESWAYFNDGIGVFAQGQQKLPRAALFALADFDLDGDLDAAGASPYIGVCIDYYHQNDGAAVFLDQTSLVPQDGLQTFGMAAGDLDLDGKPDLVLAKGEQDRLYQNLLPAGFADVPLPANPGASTRVVLGDLDADGDPDAVIGHGCFDLASLYLNTGAGLEDAAGLSAPQVFSLALGDVELDGDQDLLTCGGCGPQVTRLHANDGAAVFTEVAGAFAEFPPASGLVELVDADLDGDLDAFVVSTEQANRLHLNDGFGSFTWAPDRLPGEVDQTLAMLLFDVDADGDPDLLLGNYAWSRNRLQFNDGNGFFSDGGGDLPDDRDDSQDVALGDVDADGDLDALTAIGGGAPLHGTDVLLLNDGDGRFSPAATGSFTLADASAGAALGDVDGDGDLDAFFANSLQDRLHLNDGPAGFVDVTAASLPVETINGGCVEAGDVDLDGDLDLVLGTFGLFESDKLYLNDGTGVFQDASASHMPLNPGAARDLAVVDYDSDGDLDAFVAAWTSVRLYTNNGAGVLQEFPLMPFLGGISVDSLAVGDVDGDQDVDVMAGTKSATKTGSLLLNNGVGPFTDVSSAAIPLLPPEVLKNGHAQATLLDDFDGDGDLDAVFGNYGSATERQDFFYRNDGSGVFSFETEANLPLDRDKTAGLAAGDLDGDGDVDLYVANAWDGDIGQGHPDRIYVNLSHQIFWRALPRLGKTLALELRGAPFEVWVLALSPGQAALELPPFGVLRLDPGTLHVLGSGALDGDGRASLAHDLPPVPALLGWTGYCQALFGSPGLLSNRETILLTGY